MRAESRFGECDELLSGHAYRPGSIKALRRDGHEVVALAHSDGAARPSGLDARLSRCLALDNFTARWITVQFSLAQGVRCLGVNG